MPGIFFQIDTSADGQIDEPEYKAFQEFKTQYTDWAKRLR